MRKNFWLWGERRIFSIALKKMGLKHEPIFSDRNFGDVYLEVIVETLGREKFVTDTLQKDEKEQNKQTNLREKSMQCLIHIMYSTNIFKLCKRKRQRKKSK